MSTEALTLTPAEAAYMRSGGNDAAALEAEWGSSQGDKGSDAPPVTVTADAGEPGDDIAASDAAETVDVVVGEDGKPRDAKSGKFVPHQALHAERERRKAAEATARSLEEKFARADERLALLNEIIAESNRGGEPAPKKPADDQPIDPASDIFGAFQQAMRKIESLEKKLTDGERRTEVQNATRTLAKTYENDAATFMREQPAFGEAYSFLMNGMHRELEVMGIADEGERNAIIAQREQDMVSGIIAKKGSPAKTLYNLAVARGFKATAAEKQNVDEAAKRIESLQNGQKASFSLTGAGGASGEGLTAHALASMPIDEFGDVIRKLSPAEYRRLLGG